MSLLNGTICLESSFSIGPNTREEDLLKHFNAGSADKFIINGEFHSYKIPGILIDSLSFQPVVFFNNKIIESIHLFPAKNKPFSWSIDMENVLKEQEVGVNKMLYKIFGSEPPIHCMWGNIYSEIDFKSFTYALVLKYS